MSILVCNAGSGSFKAALFAMDGPHALRRFEADYHEERHCLHVEDADGSQQESISLSEATSDAAADALMDWLGDNHDMSGLVAVGHRMVHGADRFTGPVWVNNETMEAMQALIPLAPLHQPHNLSPIIRI